MNDNIGKPPLHGELARLLLSWRPAPKVESAPEPPHHSNFQPREDGGTGKFVKGKPEYPDEDAPK